MKSGDPADVPALLAEDAVFQSPHDVSAMDGYAVRHADIAASPATLPVGFAVAAGAMPPRGLRPGEAARIFTGAVMPEGADTVVIQENTRAEAGRVTILEAPAAGRNVRKAGYDFAAGAMLLPAGILIINASLGFYQRVHIRTVGQTSARAALAMCFALPLAYGIFRLSPLKLESGKMFLLIVVTGLTLLLINRVYSMHAKSRPMMRQRVLIFGTGTRAKLVAKTLKKSDPNVDLIGYYASPNEAEAEISAWGRLSPNKSLTDIVMDEQVDEIVVALSERRGGSMPLRELLSLIHI